MKKVCIMLTGLAMLACQPQEPEVAPVRPYKPQIEALHTMLSDRMEKTLAQPVKIVQAPVAASKRNARTYREDAEINSSMSLQQVNLSSNFINAVWDAESTSGLHGMVDQYENQIANSALTEEEKLELFTLSESIRVTAEFIDNGGEEEIYNLMVASLPPGEPIPARGKDPCVNVKDIMQGAVLGGFTGAAVGGWFGCTVGTFTVPIIGTATGCVGGAVFGFAEGFFGGVLSASAQQVIFNCLMKATMRYVPEYNEWYDMEDLLDAKNAGNLILIPIEG